MRRYFALSFLFLYIFTATEFHEWLKFPLLVVHYQEHQEKENNITFLEFLAKHYTQKDIFDADRDKDMKLPFKSTNCVLSFVIILPSILNVELVSPTDFKEKPTNKYFANTFNSSNYSAIWQPPKIV